jgi:hypothetical protein
VHHLAERAVSALWPTNIVQHHPHATVLVDAAAASRLQLADYHRGADAHEPGRWSLPLRYRQVVATGPNGSNIRDWSWQACLVAPMGAAPSSGNQGQERAMPSTGPASSALRVCYTDPGAALAAVPCTSPHLGEGIATQPLPAAQFASPAG